MAKFWHEFWFGIIDARQFAVLRILFGLLSFVYFLELLPYFDTQFGRAGWLGVPQPMTGQNGGSWSLLFLDVGPYSYIYDQLIVTAGVLSAISLTIGGYSRFSAMLTWLIWVSLWNRNPLILDGDDAVLKLMCFYLVLSPCGNRWSLDAFLKPRPEWVAIWPLRLVQFQIALIYFVSGWVKFYAPYWDDGTAIPIVLVHPQYARWDGWLFIANPITKQILAIVADVIRWWELLFPVLLLNRATRNLSLSIGLLFHLGLLATMNLRWFPIVMLALYPALLPNWVFLNAENRAKRIAIKYNLQPRKRRDRAK